MRNLISVALGQEPADLLLTNAQVINTFTGEVEPGNVALCGEWVAGVGDYRRGKEVLDLGGNYLAPAFINGHVHMESSYLHPVQYARAVVPRGTLALISDLHELANVAGLAGMRFYLNWCRRLPIDFFLMAPSCVPATQEESSGACLGLEEIRRALRWKGVMGLGEVMDFPGVLAGNEEVLAKVALAGDRPVDGHAPGLRGKQLNAYIAAGILSDHETTSLEEGREKLRRGMHLMLREGSSEQNLETLLPLVDDWTYSRCFFVTDDRTAADLLRDGDMDGVVRKAIALGLDPVRAIQLATLNPARYFGLRRLGAIAPGFRANLIALPRLNPLQVDLVFHHGRLVAQGGQALFPIPRMREELADTVKAKPFSEPALALPAKRGPLPVIEVVPGQILTRKLSLEGKVEAGKIVADIGRDILKLVVVERHRATGNIGLGLVRGFRLKAGALASSVAHDSHNIIAVGTNDRDLFTAIQEVIRLQGGLVVASGGRVTEALPLPIAGLLSTLPVAEVAVKVETLERRARELGCSLPSPFSALSFLALPVIPEIRLTDRGLVELA